MKCFVVKSHESTVSIFRSTQQHTLDTPPNTLSAITISRPNSQCIELTSLSDLDRRPDGAEQTDAGEPSEFYGSRHSNPMDKERQRTSGCSNDCTNATTFGKEKVAQKPSDAPSNNSENKNRISGTSSAGLSRTSRSSVSGASVTAAGEVKIIKQYISHYWYISYLTVCLVQDLHNSIALGCLQSRIPLAKRKRQRTFEKIV